MGRKKTIFKFDNVPTSWEDITLEKFIDIQTVYENNDNQVNTLEVIATICNVDIEELKNAPAVIANKLYSAISFINEPISTEPNNEIIINGEKYYIHYENELSFGEYVFVQDILESNPKNYGAILASLCRKENEEFDDDFKLHKFNERFEMFNNQPILKIYPLVTFFLTQWLQSATLMNKYSDQLIDQGKQVINLLMNSQRNGGGKKYSLTLRMRTLRKLENALECI